jgi:eukaryotic-like serine/threonine-protein kinase
MIGLRLNNYEVVSLLGEGGMGKVYLARHTYMGRRAAIKFLRPELLENETAVIRFLDESRATNSIGHPNIIDIIDVGMLSDGRTPYLMMEFLDGESLTARLTRARPLPIHEAVDIACQTASALGAAHARQIVHRDVKPDNLFLLEDETVTTKLRVKVLDFGIAKLCNDARSGMVRTQTGTIMGTAQYMSPEQCRGLSAHIDHRTDIYALGIILYEMLCGQVPFVSEGLGDIFMMHMTETPPPLRTLVPEIPVSLERAVLRALAKDPRERFDSMADFARAIREYDPRSALTALGGRDIDSPETLEAAMTVLSRHATPPPIALGGLRTPTPVHVPLGATPAPVPTPPPVAPSEPASAGETPFRYAAEPSWIPRGANVGAHTTLSTQSGEMFAATIESRGRRAFIAGIVVSAVVLIAGAAVLSVRGFLPGTESRPAAPAAAPAPPVPAPPSAVTPTPAPTVAPPSPPARAEPVAAPAVAEPIPTSPVEPTKRSPAKRSKRHAAAAPAPALVPPPTAPTRAIAPPPPAPEPSPVKKRRTFDHDNPYSE